MKKIIAIALALMLCVSAMSVVAFAANTVTVHAQVPADWATPYAYSWVKDQNGPEWPGVAMTQDGEWWTTSVDAGNNMLIISNNGTPQTADLPVEAGKELWVVVADDLSVQIYYEDPANGGEAVVPEAPSVPENATYYVAGVAALCGADWDVAAEANKMTLNAAGLYEKVYENVAVGDYQFKVTVGDWNLPSWGAETESGNYELSVTEAGTVTILFNAETQEITVQVNGAATEQPAPETPAPETPAPETPAPEAPSTDANYYVAGVAALCGVDWDAAAEANKMTKGTDGTYSKTYSNVAAGSYSIKITDGTWDNSWGKDGGNVDFTVKTAGDVTVKFNPANNEVTVLVNGESAQTGDMSLAAVSVALLAATAGLVAIVSKKED